MTVTLQCKATARKREKIQQKDTKETEKKNFERFK